FRHGVLLVLRQRGRSTAWLLALGLGVGLTGGLRLVQVNLQSALSLGADGGEPNLFLIDVQSDQAETVRTLATRHGDPAPELSPLIRARLTHINGEGTGRARPRQDTAAPAAEAQGERRRLMTREYNLTYGDTLGPGQTLVAGE